MHKKYKILVAEDQNQNVLILQKILSTEKYELTVADNGFEAINALEKFVPDLILLDVMMPEMDGFTTIQNIKSNPLYNKIPIIFLTSQREADSISKGFDYGAVDYVFKPFNAKELLSRISTHIEISELRNNLEQQVENRSIEIIKMHKNLLATHQELIFRLGQAAEFRDNETGLHIQRIGHYANVIAIDMGMSENKAQQIKTASIMHDVGKIGIPDEILLKPGKLTLEEFDQIKKHTTIGYELLSGIESDLIKEAANIAISHHEKWDGSGYPKGLAGETIPLSGRIVAIVDVFDALTSERPYKEAWSNERAVDLIREQKGKHFDPKIVDLFLANLNKILEIKKKHIDT